MAIRCLNQNPQYFTSDGSSVLAGGTLTFYQSGTTVLQDTYTDPTLATANTNPIVLDASGRSTDIWLNGNYRVVLSDALGNVQWTRDNTDSPQELPSQSGENGNFLMTDGQNPSWSSVRQIPDPTGNSGKVLSNDGTDATWITNTVLPELVANAYLTNDGTNLKWSGGGSSSSIVLGALTIQYGNGTFPASGTNSSTESVPFPKAFSANPYSIILTPSQQSPTAIEGLLITAAVNPTAGGFLAYADTNFAAIPNSHGIVNETNFFWIAFGPT